MRPSFATVVSLLCCLPLFACEERDWCAEAAEFPPTFTLGVGESDFTPLMPGDVVPTAWGGQGGQHIWMAVRVEGVVPGLDKAKGPEAPRIRYQLYGTPTTGEDLTEVILGEGFREWALDGDVDKASGTGDTLILDWFNWDEFENYRIDASLIDTCGTMLEASSTVQLPTEGS